ncbi:MAG: methyltransferase [Candidatus Acidiferrales bacterium]
MSSTSKTAQEMPLDPLPLAQMAFSFAPARILLTAVQLGVFSHIADGARTAEEVARAAQASDRGTRMLLDALVGFKLLGKHNGAYSLSPLAAKFLVRESPDYMGAFWETDGLWEGWGHLTEAVRSGKPAHAVFELAEAEKFFSVLTRTLHVQNSLQAQRLAQAIGAGSAHRGMRVLDVGCGSGVWGIAVAEADPDARITAQDLPEVLGQTKKYLEKHGVIRQYDYLPGDMRQLEYPAGQYDLALLGHIVHGENEASARNLFGRLRAALKPGGRLAIIDMIPNDERTGPPFPLIFALNMFLHTENGGTYTFAEYTKWLTEAGFSRAEMQEIGEGSGVAAIVGYK